MTLATARVRPFLPSPFDAFFGVEGEAQNIQFPVDVREDDDKIYLEADLPGVPREALNITLEKSILSITAESQQNNEQTQGNYVIQERRQRSFSRSFRVPPTVDEKSVQATLKDGVLTVVLSKREESKPRKIEVQ